MSRSTDIETAVVTTLSADVTLDSLTTTFDELTGGKDLSLTWESIAMTFGNAERPAIAVKVDQPGVPDRNTTNEELYTFPVEIYVIGQANTNKLAAYQSCNSLVTLVEPLISKQKSSAYNFGINAWSSGSRTDYKEINQDNLHICIGIVQTDISKIYSY